MTKPQIAVVTPVYNGEKTLERSLKSLLSQSYDNWISVIVNDGSTDGTTKILAKYQKDRRFHVITLPQNRGRGYARQIALQYIIEQNIPYMCMLDADDLYYPDKLEWQYKYMESNKDIALLSTSLGLINSKLELVGVQGGEEEKTLKFDRLENYSAVPHASSIFRLCEIGNKRFDDEMLLSQDTDFMRRVLLNKIYVYKPKISYLYARDSSFSVKKYRLSKYYHLKSLKKNKLPNLYIIKFYIQSKVKILYLSILSLFNLINVYMKKHISRQPTAEEISLHNKCLIRKIK